MPHSRGHLQLLRHTFISGVHDLNVIAAIITPRSDESVMRKCASAGKTFRFGLEERSLLWEQDLAFPSWAWVYRDKTRNFTEFLGRLKQATLEGGFKVEFAMLYGPEIASPESPPTGAYGCDIIILGDAGRQASYQRSNGRLRNFVSCTKWTRVRVDKDLLESHARTKANRAILRMKNVCQDDAQSMDEDGLLTYRQSPVTLMLIYNLCRPSFRGKNHFSDRCESNQRSRTSLVLSPHNRRPHHYVAVREIKIHCS